MSDKELFDFSAEIYPDYVGQKADEPDHRPKPARITTKKAWFMSLLLPILSILASAYPIMNCIIFPTMILGLIFGGIVPLVMIVRGRIDTSKFFLGKMILFAVLAAGVVISWIDALDIWIWVSERLNILVLPIVMIIAELIFAAAQKTDPKTKLCLALSSAAWVYLGFAINLILFFGSARFY